MAKQFTDAPKRPPLQGAKFGIPSPILASYSETPNTTMGQVVSFTSMPANQLDRCEVYFRGEIVGATCCHPGIEDGMNVNMIEQPIGVWWATVMQKSWYSRPLTELVEKGHNYQAAVEYLLSFGAKWRPRLIIIDKRGANAENPPIDPVVPPDVEGYQPFVYTEGAIPGYTINSWIYDPALFGVADTNGDGFVDMTELLAFLAAFNPVIIIKTTTGTDDGLPLYYTEFGGSASTPTVKFVYPRRIKHDRTTFYYYANNFATYDTGGGVFLRADAVGDNYVIESSIRMLSHTVGGITVYYNKAIWDGTGNPPSFKIKK